MRRCSSAWGSSRTQTTRRPWSQPIWPQDFEAVERDLLLRAKTLMPRLPFHQLDVLLIDAMGKEISGSGMDSNVLGRRIVFGEGEPDSPRITRIAVCDLTEKSHGNAIGVGLADFTTRRSSRQDRPLSDLCQWANLRLAGARASADGRRA